MESRSPSLGDLVTLLYKPRETMRRILDNSDKRWTAEVVVLATLCASFADPDIRHFHQILPDLKLGPTLAFIALVLLLIATCWVLILYLVSWVVALVGKYLGGTAKVADVRAALAWGLVPLIWSVVYRIPVNLYISRLTLRSTAPFKISFDFLQSGGCSLALIAAALQVMFDLWVLFAMCSTLAEAEQFETWKGLSTLAISAAAPVIIVIAAVLAAHSG
jgi:hypothetical protein